MRKTSMILVAVLLVGAAGCLGGVEEAAQPVEERELAIGSATTDTSCHYLGSTRWCQDPASRLWCTDSEWGQGWDWTSCDWSGWRGNLYCDGGWQWGPDHRHCSP